MAGLYEFPNLDGRLSRDEAARYLTGLGFGVDAVTNLGPAKHIFTHREWHMTGYLLRVRECPADRGGFEFVRPEDLAARYSVPTAFKAYMPHAL